MIFVDSNIFLYAAGRTHPYKSSSLYALHRIAAREIEACTNTEVLQEILHRYRSIDRWGDGKEVFSLARTIIPVVLPIDESCMITCFEIMNSKNTIIARDALHIAFCIVNGIDTILSFDTDLSGFEGIRRIEPQDR